MRIIQFAGQRGDIMARNQVSGQIEEVQENFVTVTGIGRIKFTTIPPKYQLLHYTSRSTAGTGIQRIHLFLVAASQSSVGP